MAVLVATGAGVRHRRRWFVRGLDLRVEAGETVAVTGPPGSGRTSTLLALAARLRLSAGRIQSGGTVSLAHVPGVEDPEPVFTVGEHVAERLALLGRSRREAAAVPLYGLDPASRGRDLSPYERHLLGLALASIGEPAVIALDGVDAGLDGTERAALWGILAEIAATGVAILVTAREIDPSRIDHEVRLSDPRSGDPGHPTVRVGRKPNPRQADIRSVENPDAEPVDEAADGSVEKTEPGPAGKTAANPVDDTGGEAVNNPDRGAVEKATAGLAGKTAGSPVDEAGGEAVNNPDRDAVEKATAGLAGKTAGSPVDDAGGEAVNNPDRDAVEKTISGLAGNADRGTVEKTNGGAVGEADRGPVGNVDRRAVAVVGGGPVAEAGGASASPPVGEAVGEVDRGAAEKANAGPPVCAAVDGAVDEASGGAVSKADGRAVGVVDGGPVGEADRRAVGKADRRAVDVVGGGVVGEADGRAVGVADGRAVGEADRAAVGKGDRRVVDVVGGGAVGEAGRGAVGKPGGEKGGGVGAAFAAPIGGVGPEGVAEARDESGVGTVSGEGRA